ncbi:hypothetical protein [Streptomyces sp. NPDC005780]|uniref:hypothetical protein n=1 Tax=Streptomyces sp. NPDC005780 TaxID=3364730 RepID=UPI0036A261DC
MHAAGLYLSLSVSLMKVQGTSDGKGRDVRPGRDGRGSEGKRKKGRRSVPCKSCALLLDLMQRRRIRRPHEDARARISDEAHEEADQKQLIFNDPVTIRR